MDEDSALLRRFVMERADEAFSQLVQRHIHLVHAAAVRQTAGDTHLARDVAQGVFLLLARKAPTLLDRPVLAGWLYTTTRYVAQRAVRAQRRWQLREWKANTMKDHLEIEPSTDWNRLGPVLDDVMDELHARDREALVQRYLEGCTLAALAARLGVAEDTARKRVDRALDRLRDRLMRRGIASTAAALASSLAGQTGYVAPASVVTAASALPAAAAVGWTMTAGLPALGLMSKIKIAVGLGVLAALSLSWFEIHSRSLEQQRQLDEAARLLRQTQQKEREVRRERDQLRQSTMLPPASETPVPTPSAAPPPTGFTFSAGRPDSATVASGLRDSLTSNYGALYRQLGFTAEQQEAFTQLYADRLATRNRRGEEYAAKIQASGTLDREAVKSAMQEISREAAAEYFTRMTEAFGPETVRAVQDYNEVLTAHQLANNLQGTLAQTDDPLRVSAMDRVAGLIAANGLPRSRENRPPTTEELAQLNLQAVVEQSSAFLSPPQAAALGKILQDYVARGGATFGAVPASNPAP